MPGAALAGAALNSSNALFSSLPAELQVERPSQATRVLSSDGQPIGTFNGQKGVADKLREMKLAIALETKYTKEQILPQAALLAGLVNSPSYYDPSVNPEKSLTRRNQVLGNMLSQGKIKQADYDAAVATGADLKITPSR